MERSNAEASQIGQVLDDQGNRMAAVRHQSLRDEVGLKIEVLHYAQDFPSIGPTIPVSYL